jgi:hypothetical protein
MLTNNFRFVLPLLACVTLLTCGSEDEQLLREQLEGHWEIVSAKRNNRTTETLADLYFEFGPEEALETNLGGKPERGVFTLSDRQIQQSATTIEAAYDIVDISDTTLQLRTTIRGYRFDFQLRKTAD